MFKKFFFAFTLFLLISSVAQAYKVGEPVQILWRGAWFDAVVQSVEKEDRYRVKLYPFWRTREEIVPQELLRLPPTMELVQPAKLKLGDVVEFHRQGRWKDAVFVEAKGDYLHLRYADMNGTRESWFLKKYVFKVMEKLPSESTKAK